MAHLGKNELFILLDHAWFDIFIYDEEQRNNNVKDGAV